MNKLSIITFKNFTYERRVELASVVGFDGVHSGSWFAESLDELLDEYLPRDCVLDMSGLSFMDSSGIAIIIRISRRMKDLGGRAWIENPSKQPMRVIDASGIDRLVPIAIGR